MKILLDQLLCHFWAPMLRRSTIFMDITFVVPAPFAALFTWLLMPHVIKGYPRQERQAQFPRLRSSTLTASPVLFCSDAPDFGESENEVRLKVLRLPLTQVLEHVSCCETLTRTPSEAFRFSWAEADKSDGANGGLSGLVVRPPPTLVHLESSENGESNWYRLATREEARANKRKGIMMVEKTEVERGKPLGYREILSENPSGVEYWSNSDSFDLQIDGEPVGSLDGWTRNHGYTGAN